MSALDLKILNIENDILYWNMKRLLIVPTLCVGMPLGTLRVPALKGTRSVPGCIPTQSVGNDLVTETPCRQTTPARRRCAGK
ncbi:hypothetical protein EJA70_16600 [Pseudomonas sp. PB103]|nr:hypothetical protein EJA70_16600 [Pseudomonas sp. PB103]